MRSWPHQWRISFNDEPLKQEQGVKYVEISQENYQNDVNDVFLVFKLLTFFTPYSTVSIDGFEKANASWVSAVFQQQCRPTEFIIKTT